MFVLLSRSLQGFKVAFASHHQWIDINQPVHRLMLGSVCSCTDPDASGNVDEIETIAIASQCVALVATCS